MMKEKISLAVVLEEIDTRLQLLEVLGGPTASALALQNLREGVLARFRAEQEDPND